jgi:hypothetical protein
MDIREREGDAAALLYLVPFVATAGYGLYLWAKTGLSAILPSSVYLSVARDPYVFIVGSFAVMAGVVLDIMSAEPGSRLAQARSTATILQSIAAASLVLAFLGAWYSNGFLHLTATFTDFIVSRYTVIFPAVLVLLSYLITLQYNVKTLRNPKVIGVILFAIVPAEVYEVGKRDTALGLAIALVLVIAGIWPFVRKQKPRAEPAPQ